MSIVLPFASGKGGVGKSLLAANLADRLAALGKSVILADLDWGGSNAHTLLGILNTHAGIGDYMLDKQRRLDDLVVPLDVPGLGFIPGDGRVAGAANLPFVRKRTLIRELAALEADYVVLDLGAGTHFNTVDLFLTSHLGFVVTSPEPTAVLNAYAFLKTALYRLLAQSVPAKSEARELLRSYFTGRGFQGGREGLEAVLAQIRALSPGHAEKLAAAFARLRPRIVLNMRLEAEDLTLGARLRQVCESQLGVAIEYVALVPWDPAVRASVIDRKLLARHEPSSPFSRAVASLAKLIVERGFPDPPPLGTFDDLEALDLETT